MTDTTLYPPKPADVPLDLTRPDAAYRGRVAAMIGGLFAFLVLYLVIIALAGAVALALFGDPHAPLRRAGESSCSWSSSSAGRRPPGCSACSSSRGCSRAGGPSGPGTSPSTRPTTRAVRLHPPGLPGHRVAGPGRRVYASPDVNAAVIYDTSS